MQIVDAIFLINLRIVPLKINGPVGEISAMKLVKG